MTARFPGCRSDGEGGDGEALLSVRWPPQLRHTLHLWKDHSLGQSSAAVQVGLENITSEYSVKPSLRCCQLAVFIVQAFRGVTEIITLLC